MEKKTPKPERSLRLKLSVIKVKEDLERSNRNKQRIATSLAGKRKDNHHERELVLSPIPSFERNWKRVADLDIWRSNESGIKNMEKQTVASIMRRRRRSSRRALRRKLNKRGRMERKLNAMSTVKIMSVKIRKVLLKRNDTRADKTCKKKRTLKLEGSRESTEKR